jgi:pantetheine-phosphate adenylyltransferase
VTAVYTGSFDPITRGHIDIARRAARLADRLVVALLDNPNKACMFSKEERIAFLRQELADIPNITVDAVPGMLANYIREQHITVVIRGVRNAADFEYEALMARYNKLLTSGTDTVFLTADEALSHVSCAAVKETARLIYQNNCNDEPLLTIVTPLVLRALKERIALI